MSKIVLVGPAPPYRGGIADFNEALANELIAQGNEVEIISFSLQYPSFLFPGKSQYLTTFEKNTSFKIHSLINSINPISWRRTVRFIQQINPDFILFRFWIPFMGPSLGTIAKKLKKTGFPVFAITDNVIPHEKRIGDDLLTKYFLKNCDGFITMSNAVSEDISKFTNNSNTLTLFHPIYSTFGACSSKEEALDNLKLLDKKYLLFFGLVREYKGLEIALEAMSHPTIKELELSLIVAGEFYSSKEKYLKLIDKLKLDNVIVYDEFIPKEKVKYYFGAADAVVQPYISATQSGITQVAYHFNTPMIITNVGGLPEIVEHGKQGYVCEVNSNAVVEAILELYSSEGNVQSLSNGVALRKERFSWQTFVTEMLFFIETEIRN